jgi:hypothetical protein
MFAQLIEYLSHKEFQKCVARYGGDRYAKKLSCWEQYLAMAFAQLTYRESLRDIEACLGAMQGKLYHMGFSDDWRRTDQELAFRTPAGPCDTRAPLCVGRVLD